MQLTALEVAEAAGGRFGYFAPGLPATPSHPLPYGGGMSAPTLEQTVEHIAARVSGALNHPSIALDVPDILWPWLRGDDEDGVPYAARDIVAARPHSLARLGARRLGLRDPNELSDDYSDLDAVRLALVATLSVAALAEERRVLEDRCPQLST